MSLRIKITAASWHPILQRLSQYGEIFRQELQNFTRPTK